MCIWLQLETLNISPETLKIFTIDEFIHAPKKLNGNDHLERVLSIVCRFDHSNVRLFQKLR